MIIDKNSLLELMKAFDELVASVSNKEGASQKKEIKEECNEEKCKKEEKPTEEFELTDDIYVVNDNEFLLANTIKDILTADNTELVFTYKTEDGRFIPGITEEQLLLVLLYRNRDNKERYEQIKKLLN